MILAGKAQTIINVWQGLTLAIPFSTMSGVMPGKDIIMLISKLEIKDKYHTNSALREPKVKGGINNTNRPRVICISKEEQLSQPE